MSRKHVFDEDVIFVDSSSSSSRKWSDDELLARKLQEEADDAFARSLQSAEEAAVPVMPVIPFPPHQRQPKKRNRNGNAAWGRGRRLGRGDDDDDNGYVNDEDEIHEVVAPRPPPPPRQAPKARARAAGGGPRGGRGRAGARGGGGAFAGLGQHIQDLVRQLGVQQAMALLGGNGDFGAMMGGFGGGAGAAAVGASAAHMPADGRLRSLLTRELTAEDYDLLSSLQDKEKSGAGASEAEVSLLPVYRWGEGGKGAKKKRRTSPPMPIRTASADGKVVCDLVGDSEPQGDQQQQQQQENEVEEDKEDKEEEEEGDKCIICMEPFAPDEKVMRLPCQHVFHEACARSWLKVKHSCPIDSISII